ncbi:phosphatase PAP2 family protein [Phocaeicola sp.]|uniref:phosphatase PAP2 family protein n=1 Tax=Phocaeicola sp. TaxID=2773926 RepID=UPI00386E1B43
MNILYNKPTARESLTLVLSLAAWMLVTALFVGIRPEHIGMGILIAALFLISSVTRKLVVALLPFAIFGISYDWMRIIPNYEVNPIDVQGLYEAEKSLFGITTATEGILTPNEYFHLHNCPAMDFMAGIFYLCWVPVPILFGLGLYFAKQRAIYLRFALVFLFVNLIGFAGYYIHPAAPPWYVMKYGFEVILNTPGDVAGLGRFDAMTGLSIFDSLYARNSNVFAAVPSLHSAYMVIAFYYSLKARCSNWLRGIFAFIMIGIWFTAVYSGHHYVIDAILGASCAIIGIVVFEYGLMRIPAFSRFIDRYTHYIN